MQKKIISFVIAVVVLIILIFIVRELPKRGGEESTGPIKIGVMMPLTGDAASYGESENRAIQVAVEEINKAGGINGQMIELVTEDSKCDPQAGGTAAQKLMNVSQVRIIIGGACSGETLAAAKITEPAKVIVLSPSASSPLVSGAGDFVFRTYPSDALAGKIAAKYAYEKLNARKAAILTELTDYAQGLRGVYKQAFTDLGGQIVADETYTTGDTDFRTQILKIKTANPDVIYVVPQTPTPGVAVFRQLRENGVTSIFTTAEVLLDRQVVKDNAAILEGVIGVEVAVDYEGNAKARAFRDAHRAKFSNADPGSFAANAYDAVYLIKDAIEDVGLDTEKIRDWLYGVKNWSGTIGLVTMDQNGDPVMGENVRKITNGTVTDLGAYTP
jgi:branched-chain amino acid transport system substrate-binding protein